MRKLNERKIRWIIREIEKGRRIKEVAEIQGITRVRVWQLYREYMSKGEIPELKKPGRKRVEISKEEREFVIEQHKATTENAISVLMKGFQVLSL